MPENQSKSVQSKPRHSFPPPIREGLFRLRVKLLQAWQAWDEFWFAPRDTRWLGCLRILVGGMLLYSTLIWGIELESFFGPNGWNPRSILEELQPTGWAISFWWYVPAPWMGYLHWLSCAVCLAFCVGFCTRFTSPLAWLVAVSYANRAMLANFGLDQILCALALYLALAPSGTHYSLDAWIRSKRGTTRPLKSVMSNVAARLIQLHLCIIYFFAGLSKLQGESWWNGDALWNALANYEYQSWDLTFLARWPYLTDMLTVGTVLWEISFIALVWNRHLRPWILAAGLLMHLGIGAFMGMWTFGLTMMFGYLAFLPPRRESTPTALPPSAIGRSRQKNVHSTFVSEMESGQLPHNAIIIVSTSRKKAEPLQMYFEKYGQRAYWVDGFLQAKEIGRCLCPIVIAMDRIAQEGRSALES